MEVKNPPSLFYTTGANTVTACWFAAQSVQYNSINNVFSNKSERIIFSRACPFGSCSGKVITCGAVAHLGERFNGIE
jgi:hypothetical protein